MSVLSITPAATPRPEPVRWRRVGALSTSFSLHGVAVAVFLMALSAPQVSVPPPRIAEPTMIAVLVEPPPIAAPRPPIVTPEPLPEVPAPARSQDAWVPPAAPSEVARPAPPRPSFASAPPHRATVITVAPPAEASASVDYETVSPPAYPIAAVRRNAEGEVLVRVQVGIDGRAGRVELFRSSGDRDLDRAAIGAVRTWRFQPALAAGTPVVAWVVVPVEFRLDRR